jgi:non-specific serine/threonine protein kinase
MDEALRWIEEALRLGVASRWLEASALVIAGRFAWSLGSHATGSEYVRRSIELWRDLGDTRGLANALNEHGLQSGDSGNATEARAAHEESLELYRSIGDVPGTTQTLHALGFRAEERGELETAGALLEEALALRRSMGHASGTARTLNGLGIVARGTGDHARAEALHAESLELYRGLGHELGAAYSLAYLARAAVARGDQSRAVEHARESLAIAWQHRNPWVMSLNLGVFGIVRVQQGNAEEGARLLAVSQRLLGGAEPSSATERAEHAAACDQARQSLGAQFDAAWRAADALTLEEVVVKALTEAGAADADAPARERERLDAGPLSARELEVAQRVARGLTNRQIAEELVISKWTADNHVANILRKLDLATRAQVAGWLAQRGLL